MRADRRAFLKAIAAASLTLPIERRAQAQPPRLQFGYSAITWGGNDRQAIDDVTSVGFKGIQLRASAVTTWGDRPAALRELLQARQMTFAALSSGNLRVDPAFEREDLATHARHAAFLKNTGGVFLQVIDQRPAGRAPAADDYRRMGHLLTELGKRTADAGVPLVYHHHMNSLGEKPEEVRAVLDAADRRHVSLLFDTAHYQQGGGDPVRAIEEYREWITVFHLKDLESPAPDARYRFVELGRGQVDLRGVFAAIQRIGFSGWAIVELDRVPDPARTPKQSAEINRAFLEKSGFAI